MAGRAATAFALTLICIVAPPQPPARAEEPRQDLRRGMVLAAPKVLRHLRDKGYRNVGVLKFLVKKGKGAPADNVGGLNLDAARILELALILKDDVDGKVCVIRDASATAATL